MNIVHILVGAASLALVAGAARADEKNQERHRNVTMDELPSGVELTVQREARGKSIAWMATEQENGETVYEVKLVSNGKAEVLEISEAGKILEREPVHE